MKRSRTSGDRDFASTSAARNPCLDGIRGIAIAFVVITHAFYETKGTTALTSAFTEIAEAMWVGVDLFFVLSGYLITKILLDTRDRPDYFKSFYLRRIFRIFPIYYIFLVILSLVCAVQPHLWPKLGILWNVSYLANVRVALDGWVWAPIDHLWSLSVEEQFYLIWPAFLFLAPRRRTMLAIALSLGVFIIFRQYLVSFDLRRAGVYAMLHIDGLLLGSWLAALNRALPEAGPRVRGGAWIVFFCASVPLLVEFFRDRGLRPWEWNGLQYLNYALVAASFTAIVALSIYSSRTSPLNRVFAFRPLVELGRYSYAIYLFHNPLDSLFREIHLHPESVGLAIPYTLALGLVSFLCARVSWSLLEAPCLKLRDQWIPSVPSSAAGALNANAVTAN